MAKVFVYGTLRKGGMAQNLMKNARLLEQNKRLKGYKMFSFGPYPFVISGTNDSIVGDLFEVPEQEIPALDAYEGPEYSRQFDNRISAYIYVKADNGIGEYPEIPYGDWLQKAV